MHNDSERLNPTWLVPALLCLGLVFRLIFHLQYSGSIFWDDLTIDEQLHLAWANYIASGNIIGDSAFFRAPLYFYFLGALFAITSASLHLILILQYAIGLLTGWLLYRTASEMFSYTIGVLALMLYIIVPIFIYFEGQFLLDFLILPLSLLILLAVARGCKSKMSRYFILAGIFLGLTALTRPNILIFAPALAGWVFYFIYQKRGARRALTQVALIAVFAVITIAPVTVRNFALSGDLISISSQGGINLYLGNNSEADGVSAFMPKLGHAWEYDDCIRIAEQTEGRSLSDGEVSDYWYWQAFKFALDEPDKFVPLVVKKTYLLFNNHELSNNRSIPAFFESITVLTILPGGMWLLLPLALIGVIARWRQPMVRLVLLFTATYSVSIIMFFVNSRFRLPILTGLIILAAIGIDSIVRSISARKFKALAYKAALFLVVAILCAGNAYNIDFNDASQDNYRFGNRYLAVGNYDQALLSYRAAAEKLSVLDHVHLNMGVAFLKTGELDSARIYLNKEIESGFANAKAYNNLSVVERFANNDSLSYRYAKQAIELNPGYVEALSNLTVVARRIGKHIEAIEILSRAIELSHNSPKIAYHRGVLRFDLGRYKLAEADFLASLDKLRVPVQPTFATASNTRPESLRERKLNEDEALIHYHIGTIAGQNGLLDSARIELRKAVLLDPALSEARMNLTSALNQLGRYVEAEQEAQALLDAGESSHILWYLLALTRLNLGKIDSAENAVDSAISLMPEYQPAQILKEHFIQNKSGGD